MIEMSATLTVAIASGMKLAMSIGQRGVTEGMDVHRGRQNNGKNTAKMRKRVAVRVTNTEKKVASTRRVSIVVGNHLRERTLQMTLKTLTEARLTIARELRLKDKARQLAFHQPGRCLLSSSLKWPLHTPKWDCFGFDSLSDIARPIY